MMTVDGGATFGGVPAGAVLEVKCDEVSLPVEAGVVNLADIEPEAV